MVAGFRALERMQGEHVHRNTITCNTAIGACEKDGQWQQALELFKKMWVEQVEQNTITYNAAIRVL